MTIRPPAKSLRFAQNYAKSTRFSLPELVRRCFNSLKATFSGGENIPDSVRSVAGLIAPGVDVEKAYRNHLEELYGSINIAEINDNAITHEQAQYLRDKYLWGKDV